MIFLEEENKLDLYVKLYSKHVLTSSEYDELSECADRWLQFKQEELGRTLPETYEYYASDYAVMCMRAHEVIDIHLTKKPLDRWKNKIKITVVEDD